MIFKMTQQECFNAQGYPTDFQLHKKSVARLYKQAGNGVVVLVYIA